MNAYISNDLNMVKELDPMRHELALLQADWLEKGGTIEVLAGPSFQPPPKRHEPPRKIIKAPPEPRPPIASAIRQKTRRKQERAERTAEIAKARSSLIERIRQIAKTMTYAQAMEVTGKSRKVLFSLAKEGGFSFQPASYDARKNLKPAAVDEAKDAQDAARIRAFKELGLTRNQAMEKGGISFTAFTRILAKFEIDYPKSKRGGPRPAFFPKAPKQ